MLLRDPSCLPFTRWMLARIRGRSSETCRQGEARITALVFLAIEPL